METAPLEQRTIISFSQDTHLLTWVEAFLIDRKTQNVATGTLAFYRQKLAAFCAFCDSQAITQIDQIEPNTLRRYLLFLEETGHNPGGIHAHYRTLRAFLNWWEDETEPEGWKNPIRKVKAPKVGIEPLEPVELDTIAPILETCKRRTFAGDRDRAVILALMDTGARAAEMLSMDLQDVNYTTGAILIREGKGRKPRMVYLGKKSRQALRAYLKHRRDNNPALWVKDDGERLNYWALREIMRRRAQLAGVEQPSIHAFRRYFALTMLRNGTDIFTLQKLMGHADLQILRRYLAQSDQDTQEGHRRAGPVDNAEW